MALDLWTQMMANTTAAWNGQCGSALAEANREWLDFVNRRLTRDAELAQCLGGCKCPNDVWHAYAEFWQVAARDYQAEFAELTRLGNAALDAGAASLHERDADAAVKPPMPSQKRRAA